MFTLYRIAFCSIGKCTPDIAFFTLETNIWAEFLYQKGVETLCSFKWYLKKQYYQLSDFLYDFSNLNTILY